MQGKFLKKPPRNFEVVFYFGTIVFYNYTTEYFLAVSVTGAATSRAAIVAAAFPTVSSR